MARALREAGYDVDWQRVETEDEFRRAIESTPDIVIADYDLPRFSGLRALELLRQRHPHLPFIVASGTIGEEKAAETIRLGADDYLLKDRMARLPAAVGNAVGTARERAAREYLSHYDQLTGFPNRVLFHERLRLQLEDAARKAERVSLRIIDVEHFKSVNDSLGRQAGDALLVDLARRMQNGTLPTSWFARLEADHFATVTPDVSAGEQVARHTEQQMAEVFGMPFEVGGTKLRLAARAGIALFPDDATDPEALLCNAEAALKKAKAGGERYLFYTQEMTARIAEQLALENRLRQALEKEEFVLHYQPKVDIAGRTMVGMEALIRWQSRELGLVPPLQFIPLLEETGLILEVGAWALARAARDRRSWVEAGLMPPRVAVNVSAIQLRRRDFVQTLERAIAGGASPPGIDLEITESLIMEDIHASIEKLNAVRRLGVGVAIDDFGTGYSSLFYLARLPVEALKIDRSFATMADDPATMTLVETMISLAHSLRLKVVAEGVESEAQAKILRRLGCDELQGYLFSRPLTERQAAASLASDFVVPPAAQPGARPAPCPSRSRRRVLLADDERDTVLTLMELLRQEGYEARGVYRGGDVAPAMQEFDPDVVLIDIAMPDRSGWDVAREIRAKHGPDRPVLVAISGVYRQAADQVLGKLGGFNYYIAKPCDPNVLLNLLRSFRD